MINQLELGENSDTFRHLAKQFYLQNVNISKQSNKVGSGKQSVILSADGSLTKDGLTDDPIAAFKIQNQSVSSQQNSTKLTTKGTAGKQSTDAQQPAQEESEMRVLQKQLWQQFQLLRILKQTKYQ